MKIYFMDRIQYLEYFKLYKLLFLIYVYIRKYIKTINRVLQLFLNKNLKFSLSGYVFIFKFLLNIVWD